MAIYAILYLVSLVEQHIENVGNTLRLVSLIRPHVGLNSQHSSIFHVTNKSPTLLYQLTTRKSTGNV